MPQNELPSNDDHKKDFSSPSLIKPPAELKSPYKNIKSVQRQYKLLYYSLITILFLLIGALWAVYSFTTSPVKQSYLLLAEACIALVLFALLILRFGHYTPAARASILIFIAAPWVAVLVDPSILSGDIAPLLYIILPVLLSALFLTLTETLLNAGVQFLLLVIFSINSGLSSETNVISLLSFVLLLSIVIITISYTRDDDFKLILAQDRRLEKSRTKLQKQSLLDPVTGLYNRAYLENLLGGEMARAQQDQNTVGVLMIDIDHFKKINDNYGHSIGDFVLREIGQVLYGNIRQTDYIIRHGGDELIIIMPGASVGVAQRRAEQFRSHIQELNIPVEGQIIDSVTISVGVATFPEHGKTKDALIWAADQALHEAKSVGRNRVVIASNTPDE